MFDITTWLKENTEVVDVTKKEIFLGSCPWCGAPSTHKSNVSASRLKPVFNCFRCGKHGSWAYLVSKIRHIPVKEAKAIIGDDLDLRVEERIEKKALIPQELPPMSPWTLRSWEYLLDRGMEERTIKHFRLYFCGNGWYRNRIIIPVVHEGVTLTFQARTVMPDVDPRYLSPKDSPKNQLLYNLDAYSGQPVHLVEGPTDVWRMHQNGSYAVCPLGKQISEDQMDLLAKKGIGTVRLMQDPDTIFNIDKTWEKLSRKFKVVILPLLGSKDPAEMSREEVSMASIYEEHTAMGAKWSKVLEWRNSLISIG
jgi:DNA primase